MIRKIVQSYQIRIREKELLSEESYLLNGQSYTLNSDTFGKLHPSGFPNIGSVFLWTNYSKVSDTYVSAGEAHNHILLGYLELRYL